MIGFRFGFLAFRAAGRFDFFMVSESLTQPPE